MAKDTTFIQVIEELPNDKMRIYEVVDYHIADGDDPLTTIRVKGSKVISIEKASNE